MHPAVRNPPHTVRDRPCTPEGIQLSEFEGVRERLRDDWSERKNREEGERQLRGNGRLNISIMGHEIIIPIIPPNIFGFSLESERRVSAS